MAFVCDDDMTNLFYDSAQDESNESESNESESNESESNESELNKSESTESSGSSFDSFFDLTVADYLKTHSKKKTTSEDDEDKMPKLERVKVTKCESSTESDTDDDLLCLLLCRCIDHALWE